MWLMSKWSPGLVKDEGFFLPISARNIFKTLVEKTDSTLHAHWFVP